jgi:type II secretory pathway predicted ATPase ExeA
VGTGKSLLMRLLAESWRDQCHVVLLPGGRLNSRRSLLQVILYELGLPYRDLDEGELRLSLIDHVGNTELCPSGVMLLVDEAESLSTPLLDELRSMTNLMADGEPCVRLVLFGSRRLEEKFAHPRLESFNQRLAGRFYLEAFSQEETRQYVQQQFADCGGDAQVFSQDGLETIHRATGGTPRLINQLCDHALILAATSGQLVLDAERVEEAWADLQQLPAPARSPGVGATESAAAGVIEFGPLDETESSAVDSTEQVSPTMDTIEQEVDHATCEETQLVELPEAIGSSEAPQVELIFHPAHDPFTEEFAEEELVVDQYASADTVAQRDHRQVSCTESRKIAAQLDDVLQQMRFVPRHCADEQTTEQPKADDALSTECGQLHPADTSDDCGLELRYAQPQPLPAEPAPPADDPQSCSAGAPIDQVADQQDEPTSIEEIRSTTQQEKIEETGPSRQSGRRKRSDYSRLFSRLRRVARQQAG